MEITPADLDAQYARARATWPFLTVIEARYALPRLLLCAVGSRETNLTNEVGDGGHGHGVWQLDDRSHTIPPDFDNEVVLQAGVAAEMLHNLLAQFAGNLRAALAAYNAGAGTVAGNLAAGIDVDSGTAHGNYSADVLDRLTYLQHRYPPVAPTAPPQEDDMFTMVTSQHAPDQLLLDGADVYVLTPARRDALRRLGVNIEVISDDDQAEFQRSAKPLP